VREEKRDGLVSGLFFSITSNPVSICRRLLEKGSRGGKYLRERDAAPLKAFNELHEQLVMLEISKVEAARRFIRDLRRPGEFQIVSAQRNPSRSPAMQVGPLRSKSFAKIREVLSNGDHNSEDQGMPPRWQG
jgi:hypothetical protein